MGGASEVAVFDGEIERLPPLGKAVIQGSSTVITLDEYLPAGSVIAPESIELRGVVQSSESDELGLGSVSDWYNIKYSAPENASGQVQIYYTATSTDGAMLQYSGIVYVAISLNGNRASIAKVNQSLPDLALSDGDSLMIDIAEFISDPDNDELTCDDSDSAKCQQLQLIDVYTMAADGRKSIHLVHHLFIFYEASQYRLCHHRPSRRLCHWNNLF